jgi:predicted patatin/cPLA2 family phospholipase
LLFYIVCAQKFVASMTSWANRYFVGNPAVEFLNTIRASSSLPRVPAKVFLLNPQRALSLDGGNRSSCPYPAIRNPESYP